MYKQRDKNRERYVRNVNTGVNIARNILMGPFGNGTYNRLRASGSSKIHAGSMAISDSLLSYMGWPTVAIAIPVSRLVEYKTAEQQLKS